MSEYYLSDRVLWGSELCLFEKAYVEVQDGKILSVGEQEALAQMNLPASCVHDLGDVTLLPGLIDAHNHMVMDFRHKEPAKDLSEALKVQLSVGARNARDDLMAGVTGGRYLGDKLYVDVLLRDQIGSGVLKGPWASVCGIGMKSSRAPGYVATGLSGAEAFARQSRENLRHGADFLKLFMTGTLLPDDPKESSEAFLSKEEVAAVVREAKTAGRQTAVHCIGGEGLKICVQEGVDIIEHAYDVKEDDIELLLRYDMKLCLTPGVFMDALREKNLPPARQAAGRRQRRRVEENMARLIHSGVFFAVGTDAMHTGLAREIAYLCRLGADERQALLSATRNAAHLAGRSKETGSLEPGKAADMIAVKGNPLKRIESLTDVVFVMRKGCVEKGLPKEGAL